jgi:homocysteine S-methyltransferase
MDETHRAVFPPVSTPVITDAGLETWLLFDCGIELPSFAAYPLVGTDEGRSLLTRYYRSYMAIAERVGAAIVLETPTWRANPDWAATLGDDRARLRELLEASVDLLVDLRGEWRGDQPFIVGAAVGPRGDGYRVDEQMTPDEAAAYHAFQIDCLSATAVDVVTAMTITSSDEGIGIARAAQRAELPVVISYTVETDGCLPSGEGLGQAITATDDATDAYPAHYMINCAHPTHFDHVLDATAPWASRVGALRANASMLSHAELDDADELDAGDPADLARRYCDLRASLPALHVVGGCCGTDDRHVEAIAAAFIAAS